MALGKKNLTVDKDKVKSKSTKVNSNSAVKKSLIVVAGVIIGGNVVSSLYLRQTVDVVKFKTPVSQDGIIKEDNIFKDTMARSEYIKQGMMKFSDGTEKRKIVLWEDRDKIKNAYASYYLRENAPVYWDSLTKETPKQYAYLYKMDGELLKLDMKADEFGEMLVPGDKINVRATYTDQVYSLPDEQSYALQQQTGIQPQTSIQKQEFLFSGATVLDMLNSEGASIFDLYYKLLALPKSKQQEILKSEEFKEQVKPVKMLLNVTPEEAEAYQKIQSKGANYLMTLLPRTGGNAITDALNELQTGFARSKAGK